MEFSFLFIRKVYVRHPNFLHIVSIKINVVKVVDVSLVQQTMILPLKVDDQPNCEILQ